MEGKARSLPSWECGLKSGKKLIISGWFEVTPLVGVWIEIFKSSPRRITCLVTPLVGVWIEIAVRSESSPYKNVTPLVGVWIEMMSIDPED